MGRRLCVFLFFLCRGWRRMGVFVWLLVFVGVPAGMGFVFGFFWKGRQESKSLAERGHLGFLFMSTAISSQVVWLLQRVAWFDCVLCHVFGPTGEEVPYPKIRGCIHLPTASFSPTCETMTNRNSRRSQRNKLT